jgi:hypothetical protein
VRDLEQAAPALLSDQLEGGKDALVADAAPTLGLDARKDEVGVGGGDGGGGEEAALAAQFCPGLWVWIGGE